MADAPRDVHPVRALLASLDGGPGAGQLGFVVAPAGVGKSALLVQLAQDALFAEQKVVHVSLGDSVERVRAHYDEMLRASARLGATDRATAGVMTERRRMVLSFADREFDVGHLSAQLTMLAEFAQFEPSVVIIDRMPASLLDAQLAGLGALAERHGFAVWIAAASDNGQLSDAARGAASLVLRLEPEAGFIRVVREGADAQTRAWRLDANSFVLVGGLGHGESVVEAAPTVAPTDCVLFSGGAKGSEAAFGSCAERWGIRETHFTFEGHKQARTQGSYLLSPRELEAGDVSLVYVSKRLSRTYNENGLIRRVLQTLWHMVSRSQQVFVIGAIQSDGTVVGGTGWSVELARMWGKEVWVYDQDRSGWFRWDGDAWVLDEPRITSTYICGTGTRYLAENGRVAIDDLFRRSFGEA